MIILQPESTIHTTLTVLRILSFTGLRGFAPWTQMKEWCSKEDSMNIIRCYSHLLLINVSISCLNKNIFIDISKNLLFIDRFIHFCVAIQVYWCYPSRSFETIHYTRYTTHIVNFLFFFFSCAATIWQCATRQTWINKFNFL